MSARLNPWLAFFQMVEAGAVPLETYPDANTPWQCVCLGCGQIREPLLTKIRSGQGPCYPCGNRRRFERERAEAEPQAIAEMEAAGATPLEPFPGAGIPWRCKCHECGAIREPLLSNIRHQGSGPCKPCSDRRLSERQLAEAAPQAIADMEAAGATPLEPFPGAGIPWRCKCHECGAIREPLLSSIRSGQGPCYPCGCRRRFERERAEAEPQAIAEMEAAGATPLEPFPSANKRWRCKCHECGKIRRPRLTSIRSGQGPCEPCGKRRRAERQLAEAEPQAIADMEAAGATPLEPFPGAHNPWRCACHECGLIITPNLADIRCGNQRRPCWSCANDARKFDLAVRAIADPEQWETPGVLYLVRLRFDDGASSLKLGISTQGKLYRQRLDHFRRATGHEPEPLGEWFAPRALCVWLEHEHHSERAGALKEYALDLTEKLPSGGNETYTDTPETVALFLDSMWWMGTRPAEPFDDLAEVRTVTRSLSANSGDDGVR